MHRSSADHHDTSLEICSHYQYDLHVGDHLFENELGKLTEHLASSDKMTSFLFGAGASAAVRVQGTSLIPAVAALTDQCERVVTSLGPRYEAAWEVLRPAGATRRNIEQILSNVRALRAIDLQGQDFLGLTELELQRLEAEIQSAIVAAVSPRNIPTGLPHDAFAKWVGRTSRTHPIEIFTTNYDVLIETALEENRVPIFDGFVGSAMPYFYDASMRLNGPMAKLDWTRLWKMHGSIRWGLIQDRAGDSRVVRTDSEGSGELILPSAQKYDESRKQPYIAMLDRFRDVLNVQEDGILVAIGYSFSDQHINEVIFDALSHNPRLHLFALMYEDIEVASQLHQVATRRRNIVAYGARNAVVGGVLANWTSKLDADHPSSEFLSDAGQGVKSNLGDFATLGRLFDRISR